MKMTADVNINNYTILIFQPLFAITTFNRFILNLFSAVWTFFHSVSNFGKFFGTPWSSFRLTLVVSGPLAVASAPLTIGQLLFNYFSGLLLVAFGTSRLALGRFRVLLGRHWQFRGRSSWFRSLLEATLNSQTNLPNLKNNVLWLKNAGS